MCLSAIVLHIGGYSYYDKAQHKMGYAVEQLIEALRYKPEGRGFDSRLSFQPHHGPGVDAASNRNEYQDISWGVKAAGAYG